jgi:hypothetical protein
VNQGAGVGHVLNGLEAYDQVERLASEGQPRGVGPHQT